MQERRSQSGGGKDCISAVERNNLVAVAALVVRAVVEASLRFANLLFLYKKLLFCLLDSVSY